MAETTREFLIRRRREIQGEKAALLAQVSALDHERKVLDNMALQLGVVVSGNSGSAEPAQSLSSDATPETEVVSQAGVTLADATLRIIQDAEEEGIPRRKMPDELKRRFGIETKGTSLSPCLSRFKAQNLIEQVEKNWRLVRKSEGPDVVASRP